MVFCIMKKLFIVFIVVILLVSREVSSEENSHRLTSKDSNGLLVKTKSGVVLGRHIKSYNGRTVSAFEGIPYAKPPVGPMRFKISQPIDKWASVLVANQTYTCIQYLSPGKIIGTEDCLYLYIYIPREKILRNEKLNVVVGIHSGCFMRGEPHGFCGPGYLMDRDLIYVSLNYRLSMLGFLSTEDDVVPGNNGLKDQALALRWIHDNIKYFGGNKKSVTLVGISAGGASTHLHYMSPLTKNLFTRGISISGTALNSWVLTENPAKKAKQLAKLLNCPEDPSELLVECLRRLDATTLSAAAGHFYALPSVNVPLTPFGPVIERSANPFLHDHPYNLLRQGKVKNAPWIASNTLNEGMFPIGAVVNGNGLDALNERWDDVIHLMLDTIETVADEDKPMVSEKICDFYMANETLTMGNIEQLVDLFSDRIFKLDAEKSARLHAKVSNSSVYYYLYTYALEMRPGLAEKLDGVSHLDDGRLIHPISRNPPVLPKNDETLKDMFIDFIDGFASGKRPRFGKTKWRPLKRNSEEMSYLHISGPNSVKMDTIEEVSPTDFWKELPIKENDFLYR